MSDVDAAERPPNKTLFSTFTPIKRTGVKVGCRLQFSEVFWAGGKGGFERNLSFL